MDEKDKKEKYVKFLYELTELPEAFMSLQVIFVHFFFFLEINSDRDSPICYSKASSSFFFFFIHSLCTDGNCDNSEWN